MEFPDKIIRGDGKKQVEYIRKDFDTELLKKIQIELRFCRIFITSREKMHPTGIKLYDKLCQDIEKVITSR